MKIKMIKRSKGITLIALVITIIVLLILAGISLSFLVGENGILKRATSAIEQHNLAAAEEALSLKLADIFADKLKKDLSYLEGMQIEGYDVKVSDIGRIVTMTKNHESYVFLVDSEYNINELNHINIEEGSGSNNNQEMNEDYTENLLYKANFNELLEEENGVTIAGSGIKVDSTNTYASFDGASGITVPAEQVDSKGKLLGTSDKTITLWYRANKYNPESVPIVIGQAPIYNANICAFVFRNGNIVYDLGSGVYDCMAAMSAETLFDGRWHFIVGVCEGGNVMKGYYDTVRFSKQVVYNTINSKLSIGNNYESGNFEGDLADVRIYSSALNDDQVYQLYKYGKELLKDK